MDVGGAPVDPTTAAAAGGLTFEEEMVLAAQTAAAARRAAAEAEKANTSSPAYPAETTFYKDNVPHVMTIYADLGSGGFADVKMARFHAKDLSAVAVKMPRSERPPDLLENEAIILEHLPGHENIVKMVMKGGYTCP